jgi:hypothetical protein
MKLRFCFQVNVYRSEEVFFSIFRVYMTLLFVFMKKIEVYLILIFVC